MAALKTGFDSVDPENKVEVDEADAALTATMQLIGKAQKEMQGFDTGQLEEVGESMMADMMEQFELLGEKEDYNEVVDGIMRQLLSKDLMYTPTSMICEKFPEWLAIHKPKLKESDYVNYGKQYQTFQKILAVYDTEPDNFPRLMELMFDIQKYGQPPADIIKDLAPGLKFDENGMPIMPNMGPGILPEGLPGSGMTGNLPDLGDLSHKMAMGQCSIM